MLTFESQFHIVLILEQRGLFERKFNFFKYLMKKIFKNIYFSPYLSCDRIFGLTKRRVCGTSGLATSKLWLNHNKTLCY